VVINIVLSKKVRSWASALLCPAVGGLKPNYELSSFCYFIYDHLLNRILMEIVP